MPTASYDEIKEIYKDWCHSYGKKYTESRLQIFASNYRNFEAYAQKSGSEVRLNKYADITPDEYQTIKRSKPQHEADDSVISEQPRRAPSDAPPSPRQPARSAVAASSPLEEAISSSQQRDRNFAIPDAQGDEIDFLMDKRGHRTFGRRIAQYLADRYSWYNPSIKLGGGWHSHNTHGNGDGPSLAKAWAFFEHVTLERYIVPNDHVTASTREIKGVKKVVSKAFQGDRALEIAEPGEREVPTKLYSPIHTPLSQLGDFGLGYGLYFSTLRAFAILSFLAGLINIPNLMFFSSEDYNSQGQGELSSKLLQGSAICVDREWVPCPSCEGDDFESVGAYEVIRYVEAQVIDDVDNAGGGENVTAELLNVTNYIEYNQTTLKHVYTEESLNQLYQDFKIQYNLPTSVVFEGYGTYPCAVDCFNEVWMLCNENRMGDCFLNMTDLAPNLPPYGDATEGELGFAIKNNCDGATLQQGFVNYGSLMFFILGVFGIRMRQDAIETKFDEDEQTAQDYSINILNPPHDAHDPDEWKEYFESCFENCHVTVCTVDMDNDHILNLFIKRREILRQLEVATPEGTPLDIKSLEKEAEKAAQEKKGCIASLIAPSIPKLVQSLKDMNTDIKRILKKNKNRPVTNIFVTFETEAAQREVLSKLSVGSLAAHNNDTTVLPSAKYLFRGNLVLEVDEPEEPSSIRWQELNATKSATVFRLVITSIIALILLFIGFAIIMALYAAGIPIFASLMTTVLTTAFPMISKMLTNMEHHRSETSRQKWMFIKIVTFNVALTSVLLSLITPFVATVDPPDGNGPGLISAVYALFFSQLALSPAIQLADPMGHVSRHIFAPRAKTQDAMNMCMNGSEIFLAERYANMIKFLFLIVWYCAVFPGAFFLGSFALFVVYFTDRFSLMRTWARTPQVGSQIADFARNYITPAALVFMSVVSAYFWSGFPFDNLCLDEDATLDPRYIGDWKIDIAGQTTDLFGINLAETEGVHVNFTIAPDAQVYQFCKQDLRFTQGRSFPPLAKWQKEGLEWMTVDQEQLLEVYGWTVVGILAFVLTVFVYKFTLAIVSLFRSMYQPVGKDQSINYSNVRSIDSYVPQKQSPYYPYPLLLCDLDDIDPTLFSWQDPDRPHTYYSVYEDIKDIIDTDTVQVPYIFSDVKHWPPPKK